MIFSFSKFKSTASFKNQLISYFLFSVVFLAIITSTITAWQASIKIKQSTIENALQITRNFADQSLLTLITESEENGKEAVKRAEGFHSVSGVAVLKTNGDLLISSSSITSKYLLNKKIYFPDSTQLLDEKDDLWIFSSPVILVSGEYDSDTLDPTENPQEEKIIGHVIVEYNKHDLKQIQSSIFINNIVIGSLVALVLAALMSWEVNRITGPLSKLSETMKMAKDFNNFPKAQLQGATEIQQMATVYNEMMEHLKQQNDQLEQNRNTLESEVEIRTQELTAARDSALTANRHKSEFLANISHELRTPLQAIIGYTDLVREELEQECMESQVEDLSKSIRAANSLLELINNILDLAKIEAGKMDLYLKTVDIKQLLKEAIETVQPMAAVNNNQLIVNIGDLQDKLVLDRQKVMQIWLNLLSNACKFTKNGHITMSIYNDKQYLHFSIQDTGIGIPKDKLQYIFEQFTQVDGSKTRNFEGTGLGMAITQTFCTLMKGKIEVTSQIGVGSCFNVRLPIQFSETFIEVDKIE
ncbi:MAG: hypothetical protein COW84_02395 [Gammaproteobacteria bacterium CG22_combo_CG10-13_8_21_14_all_40_8]|nr:MAG: hypothetical protein COW84_02395 [Gammaproteobacteria bacterium CG22_combo_CG10-13_8_21_14_all_40_8]